MHGILRRGRSVLDYYHRLTGYISAVIILIIPAAIVVEVILRSGFGISTPFMMQLLAVLFFVMTFLAAPWVLRFANHIRVDFAVNRLPGRARQAVNIFTLLLAIVLCAYLAYICSQYMVTVWARGDKLGYPLWIPKGPFMLVLVLAWSLLALEYLILLVRAVGTRASAKEGVSSG